MRFQPLDFCGLDVPVPAAVTPETVAPLGSELLAMRFELPVAANSVYLAAVDAWARVSRFQNVARRDAGGAHLRRYQRDNARVVLHVGIDGTRASLVVRGNTVADTPYVASTWEATLEEHTDLEVAVLEATTDFGSETAAAARGIGHRLGLPPSALEAFDSEPNGGAPVPAVIVDAVLRDKSRLQLPKGSKQGVCVQVDGARHYTIQAPPRTSAASLRKHYRAWAAAQGYEVLSDLYDGDSLELTMRRRTRGVVIAWQRGTDYSTLQIGPARQIFARPLGSRRNLA